MVTTDAALSLHAQCALWETGYGTMEYADAMMRLSRETLTECAHSVKEAWKKDYASIQIKRIVIFNNHKIHPPVFCSALKWSLEHHKGIINLDNYINYKNNIIQVINHEKNNT